MHLGILCILLGVSSSAEAAPKKPIGPPSGGPPTSFQAYSSDKEIVKSASSAHRGPLLTVPESAMEDESSKASSKVSLNGPSSSDAVSSTDPKSSRFVPVNEIVTTTASETEGATVHHARGSAVVQKGSAMVMGVTAGVGAATSSSANRFNAAGGAQNGSDSSIAQQHSVSGVRAHQKTHSVSSTDSSNRILGNTGSASSGGVSGAKNAAAAAPRTPVDSVPSHLLHDTVFTPVDNVRKGSASTEDSVKGSPVERQAQGSGARRTTDSTGKAVVR